MKVHLVDLLEMSSMHEAFFTLSKVPKGYAVGTYTPQHVFLFVAPPHLSYVAFFTVFDQTLR